MAPRYCPLAFTLQDASFNAYPIWMITDRTSLWHDELSFFDPVSDYQKWLKIGSCPG
jgi:hypothetical protein